MPSAEESITAVLMTYKDGINAASVEKCTGCYAEDGVCMAPTFQPAVGMKALIAEYKAFWSAIKLDVEFDIKEIVVASDEWAFARTTSAGTQKVLATGDVTKEGNQELFTFQKVDGEWKIARYCFATTNPPK